ncbi:TadE/TadG family type IV pilus assembly protein [Bradyrhizobium sp. SZCCHNPS2010]|uniref:TadE/TadG family type IV pilus assembly protein n=1 Tax=Bradyrhizobium sp. SZCCHNPS2010 TaxID=3057333 RepID=UPI0029163FED|nr:pilus assembly protein TadG-related protein [Bradyrhizobium sp. SZCCHNPS2010]
MRIWIGALARKLRRSRQGSVAIQMGLVAAVLIGMAALAVDIGFAIYKHRQMQSAADAAAFGAATALATGHPADFRTEAYALAAAVGYVNGVDGVVITVNHPPVSPPASAAHAADPAAVQVIITQPQTLTLVGLFGSDLFTLGVSAVALQGSSCVLALSRSANKAVSASGGAIVDLTKCGLAVYSTSDSSIDVSGGGTRINAQTVSTAGDYRTSGGGSINPVQPPINTNATNLPTDPYSGHTVPTPGTCLKTNYKLTGADSDTLIPGTYCGGISDKSSGELTLMPGVYIINGGDLTLGRGATLNGKNGVSIVLTGATSKLVGTAQISGGSTLNISAPTAGPMAGIALFQDPKGSTGNDNKLLGGSTMTITGAAYFPNGAVNYTGGSGTVTTCMQLIALTINFSGSSTLQLNCSGVPVLPIGSSSASQLVE